MAKEKLTIHRTLAELKLLTSRIEKASAALIPTAVVQKRQTD